MNSHPWLKAFLTLIAACIATIAMATTAFAGEGEGPKGKGHSCPEYADIDANADGAVTSEEFYGFRAKRMAARAAEGRKMKNAKNAPTFESLDLDGDGTMSAEEFAEHHASCPMRKKQKEEKAKKAE